MNHHYCLLKAKLTTIVQSTFSPKKQLSASIAYAIKGHRSPKNLLKNIINSQAMTPRLPTTCKTAKLKTNIKRIISVE